ncbi:MAG: hypothetical protein KKE79_06915 [Actinobacteria bacterium]|nr:hypothetical protein [Actinomycetota bacterium]MCG2794634.1 hypothetical protein [Actinomycetes bacterium]
MKLQLVFFSIIKGWLLERAALEETRLRGRQSPITPSRVVQVPAPLGYNKEKRKQKGKVTGDR